MKRARPIFTVVVLAGLAAAAVLAYKKFQEQRVIADQAVQDIESQLDSLDPVTRTAVVAKLTQQHLTPSRRRNT